MLDIARTPNVLSMPPLTSVARLRTPADFQDLPYAPAFILEYHGDALLMATADYEQGCKDGFHGYFDEMFVWNESGTDLVFRNQFYTSAEVIALVVNCIVTDRYQESRIVIPFAFSVGYALGWLSALSLTNYPVALYGLELLTVLVTQVQKVFF